MKYLFIHYRKILTLITKSKKINLFLDYDGTLTPIVSKPELASLSEKAKTILRKLSLNHKVSVAVISGRSIKQLKRKIKIKGLILAGNHGFEVASSKFTYRHKISRGYEAIINDIYRKLKLQSKHIEGAIIENKGFTLSVHFRLVKKEDVQALIRYTNIIIYKYLTKKKIKVTYGKKVLEIRPPISWDKGRMVDYLICRNRLPKSLTIYIGDDKTDESAFKRLKKRGITVFVGKRHAVSNAEYYLNNPNEVLIFLKKISFLSAISH